MKKLKLENLATGRIYTINAGRKEIFFSKQEKIISRYHSIKELSAVWRVNGIPVLEVVTEIDGRWVGKMKKRYLRWYQFVFIPRRYPDKRWVVDVFY